MVKPTTEVGFRASPLRRGKADNEGRLSGLALGAGRAALGGGGDPISTELGEATAAQSHAEKRDFKQGNKPALLISLHIV